MPTVNKDGFSLFQMNDGRWRATAQIKDQFGKSRSQTIQRKTKDAAKLAMKSFLRSYVPHAAIPKTTVSEAIAIFLKKFECQIEAGARSANTLRDYKNYERHIKDTIGHISAAALSPREVEACMDELGGEKAKANCRAFVRTVYNKVCIKDGLCVVNPAALADAPHYRPEGIEVLSAEYFAAILEAETDPRRKGFWIFLAETGDRPSEARRLTSLELVEKQDGWWQQLRQSKSEAGKRPIPVSKACIEYLKLDEMYVFSNPVTGKPFHEKTWRDYWYEVQEKVQASIQEKIDKGEDLHAEVPPTVTLYALRHFFGSNMARKVRDDILKRLMRHSDIRVTKQYYVDVDDAELRHAVDG